MGQLYNLLSINLKNKTKHSVAVGMEMNRIILRYQ